MGTNPKVPSDAAQWLTERGHIRRRSETLSILVQVAILLVAIVTLVATLVTIDVGVRALHRERRAVAAYLFLSSTSPLTAPSLRWQSSWAS